MRGQVARSGIAARIAAVHRLGEKSAAAAVAN